MLFSFQNWWSRRLQGSYFYLIAFLLALFSFHPVIWKPFLIDVDFPLVLEGLDKVQSWSDYSKIFLTNKLLDIQPVRDASLLMDLTIGKLVHHQVHGVMNFLIWISSCFVLERILVLLTEKKMARSISLLILTHPIAAWVVTWPTARKHLLALLFIMLASWLALLYKQQKREVGFWIFLCYFLALFSQPIVLFWIFIFMLYLGKDLKEKRHWPLIGLLGLSSLLVVVINSDYYHFIYPKLVGSLKSHPENDISYATRIFSISRSFTQIFVPISFAIDYSKENWLNVLGLPIFGLVCWLAAFKIHWKNLVFLILLISYPLILMNIKSTNVFLSDTYLIVPLMGVGISLSLIVYSEKVLLPFLLLTLVFSIKSLTETYIATDDFQILKLSFEREPNCRNSFPYAKRLLLNLDTANFFKISTLALQNKCFIYGMNAPIVITQLYYFRMFLDPELSDEMKLKTLEHVKFVAPEMVYLQIILKSNLGMKTVQKEFSLIKNKINPMFVPLLEKLRKDHCLNKSECEKLSVSF